MSCRRRYVTPPSLVAYALCAGVEDRLDLVDDGQHVGEGGVRRGRTHPDHVRRPEVDHHAAVGERLAQSLRSASGCSATWPPRATCSRGVPTATSERRSSTKGDQEVRERERFLTQAVDSGLPERLDRPLKRRRREQWRGADLPRTRRVGGVYSAFISNSVAFSWPHHPPARA